MKPSSLLDAVVSSSDIGMEKPRPGIFHEAARQLQAEPACILHVGDSPEEDFSGAVGAGLRAVLMDRDNARPTHPNRINDLYELELRLRVSG